MTETAIYDNYAESKWRLQHFYALFFPFLVSLVAVFFFKTLPSWVDVASVKFSFLSVPAAILAVLFSSVFLAGIANEKEHFEDLIEENKIGCGMWLFLIVPVILYLVYKTEAFEWFLAFGLSFLVCTICLAPIRVAPAPFVLAPFFGTAIAKFGFGVEGRIFESQIFWLFPILWFLTGAIYIFVLYRSLRGATRKYVDFHLKNLSPHMSKSIEEIGKLDEQNLTELLCELVGEPIPIPFINQTGDRRKLYYLLAGSAFPWVVKMRDIAAHGWKCRFDKERMKFVRSRPVHVRFSSEKLTSAISKKYIDQEQKRRADEQEARRIAREEQLRKHEEARRVQEEERARNDSAQKLLVEIGETKVACELLMRETEALRKIEQAVDKERAKLDELEKRTSDETVTLRSLADTLSDTTKQVSERHRTDFVSFIEKIRKGQNSEIELNTELLRDQQSEVDRQAKLSRRLIQEIEGQESIIDDHVGNGRMSWNLIFGDNGLFDALASRSKQLKAKMDVAEGKCSEMLFYDRMKRQTLGVCREVETTLDFAESIKKPLLDKFDTKDSDKAKMGRKNVIKHETVRLTKGYYQHYRHQASSEFYEVETKVDAGASVEEGDQIAQICKIKRCEEQAGDHVSVAFDNPVKSIPVTATKPGEIVFLSGSEWVVCEGMPLALIISPSTELQSRK